MKPNRLLPILFVGLLVTGSCDSQMVKKFSDLPKIKADKENFVDHPLSVFLAEIGIPITRVTAITTTNPDYSPGFFRFQFQNKKTIDSLKQRNEVPFGVVVYIKEAFEWDYANRPVNQRNSWTADDAKRYGNLTISRIRILDTE